MTTSGIKKKLTKAINEIDDPEFLNALHTIIHNKREEVELFELSAAQKKELDNRKSSHKAGNSKSYNLNTLKKTLLKK